MPFFTSSSPHFFKVIIQPTLIQAKLHLPKKFVENNIHGDSMLYNTATLKLPDGANWDVKLEKLDGEVLFTEGWPEFVKFYSLKVGYFLVFKLQGNWWFDVVIFDLSATEIDYPMKSKVSRGLHKDNASVLVPKSENEDEDEDDKKMKKSRKNNHEVTCSKKRKMKEIHCLKRRSNFKGSQASNYEDDGRSSPESTKSLHRQRTAEPLTEKQKGVVNIARSFKLSRKNPSFMVTLMPSHFQTNNFMSMPKNFAARYVKESMNVTLELGDGRIWSVLCRVRVYTTRQRTEFKNGWKKFADDNELHEGDICIFELINEIPRVKFRVTIFRLPPN